MEKYLLKKDWFSKRHGKTIGKGAYVIIKIKEELEELIEGEYIESPKKRANPKRTRKEIRESIKKIKEDGGTNDTTDN